jgi:N-acylneuraminate cytidylyltransferase
MSVVAFIFARGGSKGLPRKNTRNFCGKPLIAWSIEQAKAVSRIDRVIVSTDSEEIAEVARKYGAEVPFMRPAILATDESLEILSWRHGLEYLRETPQGLPQLMVSVPATAPLRIPNDIERCIEMYDGGNCDAVITVTDSHRSPYFNMVKLDSNGLATLVNPSNSAVSRRQDAPLTYDLTTVCYVVDPEFVLIHDSIFQGRLKAVRIPSERAIDIDSLNDFQVAEFLMLKKGVTA